MATILGEKIKFLRKQLRLSQENIADMVGITQSSFQAIESGQSMRSAYTVQIAHALNVDPLWLSDDRYSLADFDVKTWSILSPLIDQAKQDKRFKVDLVNIVSSINENKETHIEFLTIDVLDLRQSFFEKYNVNPKNVKFINSFNNMQFPYIKNNDQVAIDISDTSIKDSQFYVVNFEGEIMLKQIFKEEAGKIVLHNLNPNFRDIFIQNPTMNGFGVIGKVFYRRG